MLIYGFMVFCLILSMSSWRPCRSYTRRESTYHFQIDSDCSSDDSKQLVLFTPSLHVSSAIWLWAIFLYFSLGVHGLINNLILAVLPWASIVIDRLQRSMFSVVFSWQLTSALLRTSTVHQQAALMFNHVFELAACCHHHMCVWSASRGRVCCA